MDKHPNSNLALQLKALMPEAFNVKGKLDTSLLKELIGAENLETGEQKSGENVYKYIFDKSANPEWIVDVDTLEFLEVNETAINHYGFSRDEFMKMTLRDIRPEEDLVQLYDYANKDSKLLNNSEETIRHRCKNGKIIHVEVAVTEIKFNNRRARHAIITDLSLIIEKSEKSIRESEYWLKESQSAGKIGSYQYLVSEGYWKSSDVLDQIFGIAHKEKYKIEEWIDLVHPADKEMMEAYLSENVIKCKKPFNKEYRVLRPDGETIWVWGIGNLTLNTEGTPIKMVGTIQDITERKNAEDLVIETKTNYEAFFNTVDDFLFVLNENEEIIHVNNTVQTRLEYSKEELIGRSVLIVHPEDRRAEAGKIVGDMLAGVADMCPVPLITKSGTQIPVETRISKGYWNGKPAIFGVTKDISKLILSEEKFSKIFYLNPSACGLSDIETRTYVEVNDAFSRLLGYSKEEAIGKTATELGIMSNKKRETILKRLDSKDRGQNLPVELIAKDGTIKTVEISAEIIQIQDKKYRYTAINDITERVASEKALRESEEKFRLLANSTSDVIWSMDLSGKINYVSPSISNLRGYTAVETCNHSFSELFTPESVTRASMLLATNAKKVLLGEKPEPVTIALEQKCKDGSTVWTEMLISAVYDDTQLFKQFLGVTRNIQERKIAEDALRKSEEKFRLLAENSTDVIWTMNLKGEYEYISPSIFKIRGYTQAEVMKQTFTDALPQTSLNQASMIFKDAVTKIKNGIKPDPQSLQIQLIHRNGSLVWCDINIDIIYNENNEFKYFLGVTRNIDLRKKAEDDLRIREEQLLTLINSTPDFICFKDGAGRWQITNKKGIELFNLSEIDYIGKTDQEITELSPESYKSTHIGCIESDAQAWANKEVYHVEETINMPNGVSVVLDVIKVPLYNEDGSRKGLVILGRDMTERKHAAELIEESREKYRTLSDASFESIFVSEKGICIEQNATAERTFGYTLEEALGRYGTDWIAPEDREMVMNNMIAGIEEPYEATALRKDGSTFPCILRGKMMKYKNKDVRITSLTDISTLKQTENDLRESRERYKLIFQNSPVGILSFDNAGKIVTCNDNFVKIIGSSKEALLGLNMLNLPDQRVVASVKKVLNGESDTSEGDYRSITADKVTSIRAVFAPVRNGENQLNGGVGIFEDITERINAEKARHASEEKFRQIFQNSPLGIISFNEYGEIDACNDNFVKIVGSSTEKLIGLNMLNLPDKDMVKAIQNTLIGEDGLYQGNYQSVTASKTTPIRGIFSPTHNLSNQLTGGVGIVEDITKRIQAEQALIASERRYKALFEASPSGISIIDENGIILEVNQEISNITGYSREELIGLSIHKLGLPDKENLAKENIKLILSGDTLDSEVATVRKDGTHGYFHLRETAIELANGKKGVISVSNDITKRKQLALELEQKMNELLQFQRLTTGRELAMVELKKEINHLLISLGNNPKYKIVE